MNGRVPLVLKMVLRLRAGAVYSYDGYAVLPSLQLDHLSVECRIGEFGIGSDHIPNALASHVITEGIAALGRVVGHTAHNSVE